MAQRTRLSSHDWTVAALGALSSGGVAAVAVEPLAAALGATKGSFYWHFANRDALLSSALELWEKETEDVIVMLEREPSALTRLRTLLGYALGGDPRHRAGTNVELALQPSSGHPLVAPVLSRVTERRLAYLGSLFVALGFPPEESRRRGLLAYTAYLGHAQLAHATPALAPGGADLPAYVDAFIAALT